MLRSNRSEPRGYLGQGLVPGDLDPPGLRIGPRPWALEWPGETARAARQLRGRSALGAKRPARRMAGQGFDADQAAVLDGIDGAASRSAQRAIAGDAAIEEFVVSVAGLPSKQR